MSLDNFNILDKLGKLDTNLNLHSHSLSPTLYVSGSGTFSEVFKV